MYNDLCNQEYDYIVIGSSLAESSLSAYFSRLKKKVLQVDASKVYGGDCKNYNLKDLDAFVSSITTTGTHDSFSKTYKLINKESTVTEESFKKNFRNYNFDLTPKVEIAKKVIKPECKYKNSRFDFYLEADNRKIFAEIKGVTLEENGIVMFPDAPTERGVKHVKELCECIEDGFEAYIFFIIQMEHCRFFTPNRITHPEFADALIEAEKKGVKIKALDCIVKPDELKINAPVPVRL